MESNHRCLVQECGTIYSSADTGDSGGRDGQADRLASLSARCQPPHFTETTPSAPHGSSASGVLACSRARHMLIRVIERRKKPVRGFATNLANRHRFRERIRCRACSALHLRRIRAITRRGGKPVDVVGAVGIKQLIHCRMSRQKPLVGGIRRMNRSSQGAHE